MAEISWIKLSVNIFDDEKIKLIRKMPEGDAMLLIRIQLLCLAGKTNDGGAVYIGQNMYYTDEMLATICDQPLNTVRLALQTFNKFGMIDLGNDGLIVIENWEKHQNIEGMEKIRKQTRERVARYRERQKELDSNKEKDSNVTVTLRNATDKIREDKNRLDKNRDINSTIRTTLMEEWNKLDDNISKVTAISPNTTRYKLLKARINDYGQDGVVKAIKNISNSRFLQGYNDTGRTISFDWFVKPNNFIKVLEGNYADKNSQTPSERDIKKHVSPRENRSAISDREWEEMLRALDD